MKMESIITTLQWSASCIQATCNRVLGILLLHIKLLVKHVNHRARQGGLRFGRATMAKQGAITTTPHLHVMLVGHTEQTI